VTQTDPLDVATGAAPDAGRRVLVIDDELLFAKAIVRRLVRAGYVCEHAPTLLAARSARVAFEPDLILLDLRLPDGSGLDFLRELRTASSVPVIVMTAYGEIEDAVSAMKCAASDYLKKPIDLDELLINVEKVLAAREVGRRLEYSRAREQTRAGVVELLGASPALHVVREQARKIAGFVAADGAPPTVLITGETGTGLSCFI